MDIERFWHAVQTHDRAADGRFVFAVRTTGIYCRPSCPARRPLRRNVIFFSGPEQARAAGFRPCLRCRPDTDDSTIAGIRRFLDTHAGEPPPLATLAARAGLSAAYFRKRFTAEVGLSPAAYVQALRVGRLKTELRHASDVTTAVYAAGFSSSSRVYENVGEKLGMTPGQYRSGGKGVSIRYAFSPSPYGLLLLGATVRGVCFLQFGDSRADLLARLRQEFPAADLQPGAPGEWLSAALAALPSPDPALDLRATAFQARVWAYLRTIPFGSVQSYKQVAAGIGQPTATRAVARACAANPVALLIPCHRVVRTDGESGGYRWGEDRKRAILAAEKATYTSRR
jgi:AraC family transcriptional regulator, regulatory protein of adaptative response / methylated-DNA-[protein]-cysteine methyltransferase